MVSVVSSATLATLFGLYGEVSANEEAIVHQLILLCNVTKHRQESTALVKNLLCFLASLRIDVMSKLWLDVGKKNASGCSSHKTLALSMNGAYRFV